MQKIIVISFLCLSGCVSVGTSGTINLCDKLPTVSEKDTDQTIIEVDNFNAQYRAFYGCK